MIKTKYEVAIESLKEIEEKINRRSLGNWNEVNVQQTFKYIWDRIERARDSECEKDINKSAISIIRNK